MYSSHSVYYPELGSSLEKVHAAHSFLFLSFFIFYLFFFDWIKQLILNHSSWLSYNKESEMCPENLGAQLSKSNQCSTQEKKMNCPGCLGKEIVSSLETWCLQSNDALVSMITECTAPVRLGCFVRWHDVAIIECVLQWHTDVKRWSVWFIPRTSPHSLAGWWRFPDMLHCQDGKADC